MDRRRRCRVACVLALVATGCASGSSGEADDGVDGPDARVIDAAGADASVTDAPVTDAPIADARVMDAPVPDAATIDAATTDAAATDAGTTAAVVFASSQTALYRIDITTYAATLVGTFGWPAGVGSDAMADIALAADGAVMGASGARLYRCSATTAACTLVGALAHQVNALGHAPAGTIDSGVETLVGATTDGTLYRIDPATAAMTSLGRYSTGHASSGDLAYAGGNLVAAINPGGTNDSLARINTSTGATTVVGSTARPWVWGLAAAGTTLLGFTLDRNVVRIDPATGASTIVATGAVDWYGAAGR